MKRYMDGVLKYLAHWKIYIRIMAKWTFVAVIVGIICGVIGAAFDIGVELATEFRSSHPYMLYCLPLAGLLIVLLYKLMRVEGEGTDKILEEVQKGKGLHILLLPSIFVSTFLTHLCGGSAGREGAALQMGGTIGFHTARGLKLDDKDLRTATMMGMAAFFAALFGTPLAATVFALEVISVGLIYHAALVPCIMSALIAYGTSVFIGVQPTRFTVGAPELSVLMMIRVAGLSILCALVSVLFCAVVHEAGYLFGKYIKNAWLRVLIGAAAIILLTLLTGNTDYNGAGMNIIKMAVEEGTARPFAFLLKILFTAITLGSGFKGGEVVPSFFTGAVFGCAVGPLLGIDPGFAAAVGLVSVFCGAVNCPLASIFLAGELFGGGGLLYFALACGLSFVFSGYSGLYSSQRILYSKLKAQYIDVYTNAHHAGEVTEAEKAHPVQKYWEDD